MENVGPMGQGSGELGWRMWQEEFGLRKEGGGGPD